MKRLPVIDWSHPDNRGLLHWLDVPGRRWPDMAGRSAGAALDNGAGAVSFRGGRHHPALTLDTLGGSGLMTTATQGASQAWAIALTFRMPDITGVKVLAAWYNSGGSDGAQVRAGGLYRGSNGGIVVGGALPGGAADFRTFRMLITHEDSAAGDKAYAYVNGDLYGVPATGKDNVNMNRLKLLGNPFGGLSQQPGVRTQISNIRLYSRHLRPAEVQRDAEWAFDRDRDERLVESLTSRTIFLGLGGGAPAAAVMTLETGTLAEPAGPSPNFPMVLVTSVGSDAAKIAPNFPVVFQTWADLDSSGGGSLPTDELDPDGVTVETVTATTRNLAMDVPTLILFETVTGVRPVSDVRIDAEFETVSGVRGALVMVADGRLDVVASGRYRR